MKPSVPGSCRTRITGALTGSGSLRSGRRGIWSRTLSSETAVAARSLRDRKVILDKQAELFVALECERLDGLERKYQRALARADAAEDHKSLAQVGRALVALWERRARLLGLDSVRQRSEPVRTDDSLDEVARKRTERRRRFAAG